MMKVRFVLLAMGLILLLNGCQPLVGGVCEYNTTIRLVTINIEEGHVSLQLPSTAALVSNDGDIGYYHVPDEGGMMDQLRADRVENGDHYWANISQIASGSCTPFNISLLYKVDVKASNFIAYYTPQQTQPASEVKEILTQFARQHLGCDMNIEGHTSERGNRAYNLQLSLGMADAVAEIMQEAGVPDDHIEVSSLGEEQANVHSANIELQYAMNQRVEIITDCK